MFTYLLNSGDQDVVKHLARLDTAETATVKTAVSALILGLKYAVLWDKIDILCVVHNVEADSLLNLKGDSAGAPDSRKVNSPTFTASRGFLSAASGEDLINLDIFENNLNLYGLYDGHVFQYMRTFNAGISSGSAGVSMSLQSEISPDTNNFAQIYLEGRSSPHQIRARAQTKTMVFAQDTPIGFLGWGITAINERVARLNDTALSTTSSGTHTISSAKKGRVGGDTRPAAGLDVNEQFAAWGVGGGLTAAELGLYENRIRTYMQAIGADVY